MNDLGRPAFGTLAWALASGGNLTARERRSLLAPILRSTVTYTTGRLRMALGRRPARTATLDLASLRWPDTKLAREAERECRGTLSAAMANHSVRTFVFGLALSGLDGNPVDLEELYVGSLLHDLALEAPTPGRCFAVVGAERARALVLAAGADAEKSARIAEGIALHITPGIGFERGPLAPLIAAGALVDLAALRLAGPGPGAGGRRLRALAPRGLQAASGRLLAPRGPGRPARPRGRVGALRSVQPGRATRTVCRVTPEGLGTAA